MSAFQLALIAAFALIGLAAAEFPLVWVCLGCLVPGFAFVLWIAYMRPDVEYRSPNAAEPAHEDEHDDDRDYAEKPVYQGVSHEEDGLDGQV